MPQRAISRVLLLLGGLCACVADAEPSPPKGSREAAVALSVTRRDAQDLVQRFGREAPSTRAQLFGRPMLEDLLSQGDSPAVRIWFGLDPADRREHLVFTAASAQGFDGGLPCPPFCPPGEAAALVGPAATQAFDSGKVCPPVCPPGQDAPLASGAVAFDRGGLCPPSCVPGEEALGASAAAAPGALTADRIARSGARISDSLARTLTASYRAAHPGERAGICFSRAQLARLLAEPQVHGLWFFFGRRATGHRALVITAADATGALLAPRGTTADAAPGGQRLLGAVAATPCNEPSGPNETDETSPDW